MEKARVSLHRLARAGRSSDDEGAWYSEELFESDEEDERRPQRPKRQRLVLEEAYDDESNSEDAQRYRARRRALPAPPTGPERFQNSALALQGRRYHFPKTIDAIKRLNEKNAADGNDALPMNDGSYYRDEDNYSGAFTRKWIKDVVNRETMLDKDATYNFLTILATRLQIDVDDTLDIDMLDNYVEQTRENVERRKKDAERTLVTVDKKKEQLAIMRELRWRERVEHDVARLRYEHIAPHRALAEVANALYARFEPRPEEDRKRAPVLRARPGVHVIDSFLYDLRLFILLEGTSRGKRPVGVLRLARSAENRALAARSPLYQRLTEWYRVEAEANAVPLEGTSAQWVFTQPELRARFRGLFLLAYFYLDENVLRTADDAPRASDAYQPPLQYVHAAYRWVWERTIAIKPALETAEADYRDGRAFWNRMHISLDTAERTRELPRGTANAIRQHHSLRQLWNWLAAQPNDPLRGLRIQEGGRIAIAERIDVNLARARRACIREIHRLMLQQPPANESIENAIRRLARQLAIAGEASNDGAPPSNAPLTALLPLLAPADQDRIARLREQINAPVLERTVDSIATQKILNEEKLDSEIPKLEARERELARNTFPFSFIDEAELRDHIYYVTMDPAARLDRVIPTTQLRTRDVSDPSKSTERQEAEESPQRRIQRVYVRANQRALAAISGFGAYHPTEKDKENPMHAYTVQQDPTLLPAVLLAETFAVRLYQVEHAAERLSAYEADIREIEGIIANIATERPALPDRDALLRKYVAPSRLSVQWRMQPSMSGRLTVNPEIRALVASTMFHVRNANPELGAFTVEDVVREENEDFMLAFIECVVVVRNTDQLQNPVASTMRVTVGNVKQFGQAAFRRIKLFRRRRVLRQDVAPPQYMTQFYYPRSGTYGQLGHAIPPTPRPFG